MQRPFGGFEISNLGDFLEVRNFLVDFLCFKYFLGFLKSRNFLGLYFWAVGTFLGV